MTTVGEMTNQELRAIVTFLTECEARPWGATHDEPILMQDGPSLPECHQGLILPERCLDITERLIVDLSLLPVAVDV